MGNKIGVKGGKQDLKIFFQNIIRRKKKEEIELSLQREKQEKEKNNIKKKIIMDSGITKPIPYPTPPIKISEEKENAQKNIESYINNPNLSKKQFIGNISKEPLQVDSACFKKFKKGKTLMLEKDSNVLFSNNSKTIKEETHQELNFIEKQMIEVINQKIDDSKFELKKIDSEIYTIQKNIDSTMDDLEILKLEKEVQELLDKIETIKKQISSLERTLDLKFPIDNPDNYLIYLTEEYKQRRKEEIDFASELRKDPKFKSIIDTLIELEKTQENVQQKLEEKKEDLQLDQDKIEKLQDSIIDMEEINQKIRNMIERSKEALNNITNKVNETVQITEKVNYITKQVNNSFLELFLLMRLFKRNVGIKNSAIAAATAAIALDMIIKMTTPIQKTQVVKSIQFTDYKDMIECCLSDTDFLENMLAQNLNQISSLRYTLEHDYEFCSYLSSYQETLEKFAELEENMREHQKNIAGIKKDMEYQLKKNNAKVKKYDSIND